MAGRTPKAVLKGFITDKLERYLSGEMWANNHIKLQLRAARPSAMALSATRAEHCAVGPDSFRQQSRSFKNFLQKFQQKAPKQTKQKKSKSAEFLMVKEDKEAMEGIGNPAFNMSSPDLSRYQTSEKKVIRHDVLDRTLAAHQQKCRLLTSAEPKGNEYSRNYFDPLMDEEINPRQCGMEVSREVHNRILYDGRLRRLFGKNGRAGAQDESIKKEPWGSEELTSSSKSLEPHRDDSEAASAYSEFRRCAQKDALWLGSSSLKQVQAAKHPRGSNWWRHTRCVGSLGNTEQGLFSVSAGSPQNPCAPEFLLELLQLLREFCLGKKELGRGEDLKFEGEELNQYIPMSCLKTDKTFKKAPSQPLIADLNVCQEDSAVTEGTSDPKGAAGPCLKVEQCQSPQPLQIQMKCIRGLKNKAPQGSYLLKVSLLSQPGGRVLHWWQTEQLKTRTHPVRHDGNFYDVGLYFHENLYVVLPPKKDVKPGMAFLFELFLLRGKYSCVDCVVGWSAFPLCDNNFDIVEGKFKCPLLRGHYDQKLNSFRKIEDFICLDLDHWLCNLYFQVVKLPLSSDDHKACARHIHLPPEFPVCLMTGAEKTKPGVENTTGLSKKEKEKNISVTMDDEAKSSLHSSQGSILTKIRSCPSNCDLSLLKEDQELRRKGESLNDHSGKEKSSPWRTGEIEDNSQDISYLEELEKHRYSVCCPSVAGSTGPGEFFKHLHFALGSVSSELQLAQWRSQAFWYIILLMASLWFLRLYLHYLSQWLFLQAMSTPVTKFQFSPLTVELCYPSSSLQISEELLVVVSGPLMLNAMILPLVLIRWGCQLLFADCPDALSKLIIAMGLWTVLDPLAVFLVDTVLGRLTPAGEGPVADAAKLYWAFVRTTQSGALGVMLTVLIDILLVIISSLILYLYCLRLCNDSWILDAFQRIHSEETKFFMPYDLEISNQELSYIVKKSEQWRGIHGERRKVAVYDYTWKSHAVKSGISSCDPQHLQNISESASGPGDITSHVSVYTVYPSGFRELYRHFLRLPGGAIIEMSAG
ncbi:orofacial cleft 1 candidate gene 1 protein [Molossus molossus]|uniref:orofacial cleft 1 candidate gene 1 protein n=1 Tax=Molossus molossus TaxID=27622 RepID=UPI0017460ACB|nr:orofacial cleft 1 candidate gene 1 protein [Molossus molossus]